jgi:hypothetical protein
MPTRAAACLEDQIASLEKKFDNLTQHFESTMQQQSARLDALDGRFHELEKHVVSLADKVQENSRRILSGSQSEQGQSSSLVRTCQNPVPFEGNVPWESYKLQFEMLAEMNCWNERDRAAHLALCLRGPAMGVLTSLQPEMRQDYHALIAALDVHFGVAHQTELNQRRARANSSQVSSRNRNVTCWKCRQKGHKRRDCKQKITRPQGVGKQPVVRLTGQSLTGTLLAPKSAYKTDSVLSSCDSLIVTGPLNGRACDFTIDTGSNISNVKSNFLTEEGRYIHAASEQLSVDNHGGEGPNPW